MKAILAAVVLCLAVGVSDNERQAQKLKMFELKGIIEAIPRGTDQRSVAALLQQLKLPYHAVARKDFRYDSGPSMVEPLPAEAENAYSGGGGGRPGKDDNFVVFVVLFDSQGRAIAAKAMVLGYQ